MQYHQDPGRGEEKNRLGKHLEPASGDEVNTGNSPKMRK
jgi:hypothetical protein